METFKLSLHSHTTNFVHFLLIKPNKKEYLKKLLKKLFRKHGHIVLGISNFNNDNRYKKLFDVTRLLPKNYQIDSKYKDYFFSIEKNHDKIYFIKTDEIETDKGHILIIGFKGKIKKRNLKKVLKEAHKQNCVIIANHPLHEFYVPYVLIKKLLGGQENISLNIKDLKLYKKDFDALEINSYFPEDWNKIKNIARKYNKNIVSDSDAHFLNEIFTSWYEIKGLNFNNPSSFKKSLKKALKRNLHLHAKKYGYTARYKHAIQIIFENFGKKIGLIKK